MKPKSELTHPAKAGRNLAQEVMDEVHRDWCKPVSSVEEKKLTELEKTVSKAVKASIAAARALHEIYTHKDGIYWKRSYKSFEEYCGAKWGYKKAQAYRLLGAGEFLTRVAEAHTSGGQVLKDNPGCNWYPQNEAQVRQVIRLPSQSQVVAWNEIIAVKPAVELSASDVANAVSLFARRESISLGKRSGGRPTLEQQAEKALEAFVRIAAKLPNATEIQSMAKSISKLILCPK